MSTWQRKPFRLWHSILGVSALLFAEGALVSVLQSTSWSNAVVLSAAALGGAGIIFVATEAIEEVRNARHMLILLSLVMIEFILFFAFQYGFFMRLFPTVFTDLHLDPISLVLQSTMVFVFNPLYLPKSISGRALMLINTLESLVLVFFVFQNLWQFRTRTFIKSL